MKYSFKYNSNTSFRVVPSNEEAGYDIMELREIYETHLLSEYDSVKIMTNDEFLKYFGVKNE